MSDSNIGWLPRGQLREDETGICEKRTELFSQLKTDKLRRFKKHPLFSGKIGRKKGTLPVLL